MVWSNPALSMFYIYLLGKIRSKFIYIGFTNNLQRRIEEHKKDKINYKLIYYEAYVSEEDARKREYKLKNYGSALGHLKKRLSNTLSV